MRIFLFTLLVLAAHLVCAQKDSVSVKEKFNLLRNKVSRQLSKVDTIRVPTLGDSLRINTLDSLKRKDFFGRISARGDTLRPDFTVSDTIKRIRFEKPSFGLDTINRTSPSVKLPGDSVKQKAGAALDKANRNVNALQGQVKSKADSLMRKGGISGLPEKLNDQVNVKLPGTQVLPTDQLKMPSMNEIILPASALPTNEPQLPEVNSVKVDPNTSGLKVSDQSNNLEVPGINISGQQSIEIPELPNLDPEDKLKNKLPNADIPNLEKPDSARINEWKDKALEDERLKKYAKPVDKISERVDPYKKDLDSLTMEDVREIAATETESVVGNTHAVSTLNEQVKLGNAALAMPQQAALIQRYQDKKILKDEMLRKSKNVMNEKITSLTPQVTEQQKKLGRLKRLNSSAPGVKNMKRKRTDPLNEKPFYERIVPGVSLQSYSGDVFALDVAPQVIGRITSYWDMGGGMFYRLAFDKKYSTFIAGQGVHGFRTFMDYRLVKGIFVHAEYEKTFTTHRYQYTDRQVTSAFNSTYIGLGKRYPISRKIYGNLLALYKIKMGEHLEGTSKFNLRVVFEYKTKKVRKPTSIQ